MSLNHLFLLPSFLKSSPHLVSEILWSFLQTCSFWLFFFLFLRINVGGFCITPTPGLPSLSLGYHNPTLVKSRNHALFPFPLLLHNSEPHLLLIRQVRGSSVWSPTLQLLPLLIPQTGLRVTFLKQNHLCSKPFPSYLQPIRKVQVCLMLPNPVILVPDHTSKYHIPILQGCLVFSCLCILSSEN